MAKVQKSKLIILVNLKGLKRGFFSFWLSIECWECPGFLFFFQFDHEVRFLVKWLHRYFVCPLGSGIGVQSKQLAHSCHSNMVICGVVVCHSWLLNISLNCHSSYLLSCSTIYMNGFGEVNFLYSSVSINNQKFNVWVTLN